MQSHPVPPIIPVDKARVGVAAPETIGGQTPLMVIGLAAISLILLINFHPQPAPVRDKVVSYACAECGTVVGVRRTASPAPSYAVEIQMLDGSMRTVQPLPMPFKLGDIVHIHGNALTLRSAGS